MPDKVDSPTLFLCSGKHCAKKRRSELCKLERAVNDAGIEYGSVSCLGSCSGPAVLVTLEGTTRAFEDLRSGKARASLVSYVTRADKKPAKPLRKREFTGKKVKRAVARVSG